MSPAIDLVVAEVARRGGAAIATPKLQPERWARC